MIKLIAIFGQNAVTEYENTGTVPSADKEYEDGSLILTKEFLTEAERDAYIEALNDGDGADNWRTIPQENNGPQKLQFRKKGNYDWEDFPAYPTIDNYSIDFPSTFMHSYHSSDYVAWEDDMQKFIDDEITLEEFKEYNHDIETKEDAEVEMKRLRQIIINETMENFFSDLSIGKIEFRQVSTN